MLYLCTRNRVKPNASSHTFAEIAQLVEHNLAKVGVASSSLVFRSTHSDNRKIIAFFCAFRGRVRDHIDNPSKPPFDKGGFAWSRKRDSPRATPHTPFRGWGCKYSSREIAPRSVCYIFGRAHWTAQSSDKNGRLKACSKLN